MSLARPPRRQGFSLVLSLTLMAMLLLLCIGGATLLAIDMRVSRITISHAKARLNAIAAAHIALGTLQGYAGPDRRITAPSSILDNQKPGWAAAKGVPQPRLTGVWRGRSVGSAYQSTHDAAFLGWLTSGDGVTRIGDTPLETTARTTEVGHPKMAVNNRTGGLLMLSAPKNRDKGLESLTVTDSAEVYAIPENIPESSGGSAGSLAWWVADENMKANLTLRLPEKKPSVAEALALAQNASRMGLKVAGDGIFEKFPESLKFKVPSVSRESLAFDTDTPTDPSNSWWSDERNHYHDITPYSESLLTDVVNGGLKYDLSLMLALDRLPDGYRDGGKLYPFSYDIETAPPLKNLQLAPAPVGLESTVPGAGPYAKAKGLWLAGIPEGTTLDASTLPDFNKLDWTGWPDLWSFARIYRLAEPAFKDTNPFAARIQFDPQTGIFMPRGADLMCGTRYFATTQTNTQNFLDRNAVNAVDMGNLSPWRMPVITALQMTLSVHAKPNPATPGKNDLYLIVRPYVQLWNPYNVPLRFGDNQYDSLQLNIRCLPGKLQFTTKDTSGAVLESKAWNDWRLNGTYGPVFNMSIFAPDEFPRPLAPGEVRVYSPRSAALTTRNTGNEPATRVAPGLRPTGGYEFQISSTPFDGDVQVALLPNDNYGLPAIPGGMPMHICIDWNQGGNDGGDQRQGNGHGVFVEWNGVPDVALKIEPSPSDVSKTQLNQPQGQAFARLTMRLRSETTSAQRSPFLAYGDVFRQVYHPKAAGSFGSNPEMRLSPFEFCHSKIRDDSDLSPDNPLLECNPGNNRGYAFAGYTAGDGIDAMVLSHLPLAPVASLGDLRDARLGGGVSYHRLLQSWWENKGTDPNTGRISMGMASLLTGGRSVVQDAFGNSFGHPMIPADKITAASAHLSEKYYDFSWIMNSSLWDAYCATGFSPENSSVSAFAGRNFGDLADDFLLKGGHLANRRILFRDYGVGGEAIKTLLVSGDKPTDEAFAKAAAVMSVNGGFNVNSTSVRAWRSLLAGLNQSYLPQIEAKTPLPSPTATKVNAPGAALRSPIQNGPLAKESDPSFNKNRALAGRELTEDQLTELAQKIVEQVKLRGPFLSLGEFMNRRLEKGPLGEKGAVQAAIDATKINDFAKNSPVQQVTDADAGIFPNPAAVKGSQARGMPGVVCQADIVSPLATELTARSDTFVIRAAGTSDDGAVAHIELVVRREADYCEAEDAPYVIPDKLTKLANKVFGRHFAIVANRWLNPETL